MIRYRLLRSPAFWLGLWILLFLLWAWKDSMHWGSGAFFPASKFEISVSSSRGGVGYSINRTTGISVRHVGDNYIPLTKSCVYRDELSEWTDPPSSWLPAVSKDSLIEGDTVVIVAWWLVILLHLVLWGAFVAWRWKRTVKLACRNEPA